MVFSGNILKAQLAGVAESADAQDLIGKLSALRETGGAEPLKLGETLAPDGCGNPEPSPPVCYGWKV